MARNGNEPQVLRQTKPGRVSEGRRMTRLASSRIGENPPYGMNRGGGGNEMDGLMTVCHDARKGRYVGSHWPNQLAPPLHSTTAASRILLRWSLRFINSLACERDAAKRESREWLASVFFYERVQSRGHS